MEGTTKPEDQPQRPFGIKYPNTQFRFVVLCLDRDTGQVVWEKTATQELPHEGHHGDNSHASASPTTDGKFLYVSFGSRGVFCYDLEGELQWKRKLDNVETRLSFGEASSPVIHGDVLVLNRDNETKSQILALDAAHRRHPVGSLARRRSAPWATPLVVESDGRTQVITSASNARAQLRPGVGRAALGMRRPGRQRHAFARPVREPRHLHERLQGEQRHGAPAGCARATLPIRDRIAWRYQRDTPYVPSPLLYGEMLYFNKSNSAVLTCLDAKTGKPLLEAVRLPGLSNIYASPVGAADRVYLTGRDGTTLVIKRGAALEVLATNKLDDAIDASPAISGKQLFLRGRRNLYCLEVQ